LFALCRPREYKAEAFNDAWRDVLLFSEHTWGAAGSVTQPEATMTVNQWDVKRAFALEAEQKSRELFAGAKASSDAVRGQVHVVNTSSWPRGGIVLFPRELSTAGDRVVDASGRSLASQRLSTDELAVLIPEIPALSTAQFKVTKGSPALPAIPVTYRSGEIRNGHLRARIDETSGDMVELAASGSDGNLIDSRGGWTLNQFVLLQEDDVQHLGKSGAATLTVEETGPLIIILRVESSAPLCESLVRRVRLAADQDFIELQNTVDKRRAGYAATTDDKGRYPVLKESIQFAFPFAVENGQLTVDVPFAQVRPELDQLPGSCKNWMPVGRWVDVSNADRGITWATLDAPLIEVGGITATKLNSQTDPEVWLRHLDPTQTFFSWVMNNHWGTNYRAWQEGPVTFRYALRPHKGADFARATQFATGLSQPLVVMAATHVSPSVESLLHVEPASILVEELKPSADGNGWIARLFNASGQPADVTLRWSSQSGVNQMARSNLAEDALDACRNRFALGASELIIIRAERHVRANA
jgi:alpha-mannosidase